jgi:hypothetical protein
MGGGKAACGFAQQPKAACSVGSSSLIWPSWRCVSPPLNSRRPVLFLTSSIDEWRRFRGIKGTHILQANFQVTRALFNLFPRSSRYLPCAAGVKATPAATPGAELDARTTTFYRDGEIFGSILPPPTDLSH